VNFFPISWWRRRGRKFSTFLKN